MTLPYQSPQLDRAFEALAHPKRRGIVHALALSPATVSHLAGEYDLSLPAIHKHMRMLEAAELIERRKVGRINFVALRPTTLAQVQAWLGQFHTHWGNDQATLDNYIDHFRHSN